MNIHTISQEVAAMPFSLLILNSPEFQLWTIASSAVKHLFTIIS
ncbi:MAG TPA: hypothetical protein VJ841_02430 [Candidatus Saccharimonadales bacterium]|nr:hypothetical protein [Candidatus Saccharimonadales bacterium]